MVHMTDLPATSQANLKKLECPVFANKPWVRGAPLAQRRVALISTAGLMLLALALAACGGDTPPPTPQHSAGAAPVAAETSIAEIIEIPLAVTATGSVQPWRRVSPGTKILGRINEVLVREGDRVGEGQLLAQLESRDLEAAVEQGPLLVDLIG